MTQLNSIQLLKKLQTDTQKLIHTVKTEFALLRTDQLEWKPAPEKWSIAQCLEHLNTYGRYYNPTIQTKIAKAVVNNRPFRPYFSSGFIGNYAIRSMKPKPGGEIPNKMKTLKNYDPAKSMVKNPNFLSEFLMQQEQMLLLIEESKRVDLQRVHIPITITSLIRLRLGDCLQFIIAHNQRHVLQAQNVTKNQKFPT